MSAWRLSLKAIYNLGPGRHLATKFDRFDLELEATQRGLYQCVAKGYVTSHVPPNKAFREHKYSITKLGLDIIEGRAEERSLGPRDGVRSGYHPAATWLASLPRRNEITL